ncbi:MAG TPA: universal stress protein [Candidatus Sulfotelmatobacter sp.]|nr:universal stress protein [Candidatus Sulfotelmatobacter sp.]
MDSLESTPIRFDRILLTTDFSSISEKALPYAAAIARHFGATLHVVHVIATEDYAHIPASEHTQALARMKQEAERQIMGILATSHFQGIPHNIILDHGDVLAVLSRIVEEQDIDLIVTGTHGKHGLEKLLSGSMAEEIFRLANVPVLAIGPEVVVDPQAEVRVERILYATDFSPESRRGMRYAHALATEYGAHLYFLHIVEDVWQEPFSTRVPADTFCRLKLHERGFSEFAEGVQPEFLVEFGMAEELTLEVSRNRDIQLIVLTVAGTAHPVLSAHLPGPIAYNIVSHASCPVLGVRGKVEMAKDEDMKARPAG